MSRKLGKTSPMRFRGGLMGDGRGGASIDEGRAIVVLALAIGVLASVFAQPAIARKRPNLDVINAEASVSPRYVFPGVDAGFTFEDVTKNKGTATAGRSVTAYLLVAEFDARHREYTVASRSVPRLRPGESDRGGKSKEIGTRTLPLGAYELQVCADEKEQVRESSEQNCENTGKEFYVVQQDWQGSISGVGAVGSASMAERWHSSGHLGFDRYLGDGVFRYTFSGVVQWTDNGVNTIGCHLTGSGTQPVNEGNSGPGVKLMYGDAIYLGTEALYKRFYKIYQSGIDMFGEDCAAKPLVDGPVSPDFLQIHRRSLVFDQKELKGSSPGDTPGAIWRWSFS